MLIYKIKRSLLPELTKKYLNTKQSTVYLVPDQTKKSKKIKGGIYSTEQAAKLNLDKKKLRFVKPKKPKKIRKNSLGIEPISN